jgi:hypothetical protein
MTAYPKRQAVEAVVSRITEALGDAASAQAVRISRAAELMCIADSYRQALLDGQDISAAELAKVEENAEAAYAGLGIPKVVAPPPNIQFTFVHAFDHKLKNMLTDRPDLARDEPINEMAIHITALELLEDQYKALREENEALRKATTANTQNRGAAPVTIDGELAGPGEQRALPAPPEPNYRPVKPQAKPDGWNVNLIIPGPKTAVPGLFNASDPSGRAVHGEAY